MFKIKMNFQKKLLLSIIPSVIAIFIVLGYYIYNSSCDSLEVLGRQKARLAVDFYASKIENEFDVFVEKTKAFADVFADYKAVDVNIRRKYYAELVKTFLKDNEKVLAYWADFDQNAFDGKDSLYRNVDIFPASGRFNVTWNRATGKPTCDKVENMEEWLTGDYAVLPRQTKKLVVTEPFKFSYTENKNDEMYMSSIAFPIFREKGNGNFSIASPVFNEKHDVIGTVGIDISLNFLIDFIGSIEPLEGSYITLLSQNGYYLSHSHPDLVGKHVSDNYLFSPVMRDSLRRLIATKQPFDLDDIDAETGKRRLLYFSPVDLGGTESKMMIAVVMPHAVTVSGADELLTTTATFFIIALLFVTIVVVLIAYNLSSPLKKLDTELDKLSTGDLSLELDKLLNRSDEAGDLAHSIEKVNKTLSSLIHDIEILATSAASGKLDIRADAAKYSGAYKSLLNGSNKMLDNINDTYAEPLQVVTEFIVGIANGDKDIQKVTKDYKGDLIHLKNAINTTHDILMTLLGEIANISNATKDGNLNVRADGSKMSGAWSFMIEGINGILESTNSIIEDAGSVLSTMSTGNLTAKITKEYSGKFNEMKQDINNLGEALVHLIARLQTIIHTTASISAEISSTAETLATATQEQSHQTEEVASAMEEMARTVTTNAHSATKTADVAKQSGLKANDGGKIVELTVHKMKQIADVVKTSADNMSKLGESSQKIGEILNVINNIADQTNLLSLNAAIEAARAGEYGKGFAVVADSVGKLAVSTSSATKGITDMINMIQADTEKTLQVMDKGTMEVLSGIELADKAGLSLEEILTGLNDLLNMISEIATASEEQAATSEQISRNITTISKVTAESARNIEDIASTANELARMTESLTSLISQFKLDNSPNIDSKHHIAAPHTPHTTLKHNNEKLLHA